MRKIIIVAVASNGCIGRDGKLPWHYPEDLKWFRHQTTGGTVLMGLKTWESLGKKLLHHRRNIVLAPKEEHQDIDYHCDSFMTDNIQEALDYVSEDWRYSSKFFFIGGGEVYRQALDFVDEIILTKVPGVYDGDIFFPIWPLEEHGWKVDEEFDRPEAKPLRFFLYKKS